MYKVVTLRCPGCGETYSFNVGAGAHFATWHDVAAHIGDKKEYEKLLETYMEISGIKSKAAMNDFANNPAVLLSNVKYEDCGEDCVKLLDKDEYDVGELIDEKTKEGIASSAAKWALAAQREGIIAYEAMYLCPKTKNVKQGIHLSMHWLDDKKREKTYVFKNKCGDCGAQLMLIDDENVGFMHENHPTIAHCEKCGAHLTVDKVVFKSPFPPPKE